MWLQQGQPRGGQHKCYSDYKSTKRIDRRLILNRIDKYKSSCFDHINQAADSNYKLFWKLFKKQEGSSFEACNALAVGGQCYYDSHVVNGFIKHLLGVFGSHLLEDEVSPDHEQ